MKRKTVDLSEKHCVPCKGGALPMTDEKENRAVAMTPGWEIIRNGTHTIRRNFRFVTYMKGIDFVKKAGALADSEDHHPVMCVSYKKVQVEFHTHAINGLSMNDFIMAAKINLISGPLKT